MKTYIVHLGKSNKRFKLQAHCMDEISVLIAAELPDEWYGMSIQIDDPTQCEFMCNAVKSYYDEIGDNKTPLEIATQHMLERVRHQQPELKHWTWDPYERDEVCVAYKLKEGLEKKLIKEID